MLVHRVPSRPALVALGSAVCLALVVTSEASSASAAPGDAGFLGAAETFSVLAYSTVTNSGADTFLDRDLGLDPGLATTGLMPLMVGGATHISDATSSSAQTDADTAATSLMAAPNVVVGATDLASHTFLAGSYSSATSLINTGVMTLQGDEDDVFIFTAVSSLTIGGSTAMVFQGGAQACNVFWRIGSTTAIGTDAAFAGTVISYDGIAVNTDATIDGRLISQTNAVTLLNNVFTTSACAAGGDGDRTGGNAVPVAPTVTPGPALFAGGPAAASGSALAETAVDVRRPATVGLFILLLGVVAVAANARCRPTGAHRG